MPEVVWLTEERTFGFLINRGAEFSRVRFERQGIEYEILVENDEYEFWEERATGYESE